MGLCFSFQNKNVERISSLFIFESVRGGDESIEGTTTTNQNGVSFDQPDHLKASEFSTQDEKCKVLKPTYESKEVQVDWINPSIVTNLTPTPPSYEINVPPPVIPIIVESQSQEERRRKREERKLRHHEKARAEITLKPPFEYLEEKRKLDIEVFSPLDKDKKCLVLDIDYTIFDHKSDFDLATEFKRPYLYEFLKACGAHYNVVIWSATAFYHVHTKMEKLQLFGATDFQICCALCKDHMIPHSFFVKRKTFVQDIKPLSLLWTKFPDMCNQENTIHIDDVAENFALNPQNGLRIDPFREALIFRQTDKELFYLTLYLTMVASLPSFTSLDHSRWKDYIINTLWGLQTQFTLPSYTAPGPPSSFLLQQHEQSLLLKRALKEKAKEREREERKKEKGREKSKGKDLESKEETMTENKEIEYEEGGERVEVKEQREQEAERVVLVGDEKDKEEEKEQDVEHNEYMQTMTAQYLQNFGDEPRGGGTRNYEVGKGREMEMVGQEENYEVALMTMQDEVIKIGQHTIQSTEDEDETEKELEQILLSVGPDECNSTDQHKERSKDRDRNRDRNRDRDRDRDREPDARESPLSRREWEKEMDWSVEDLELQHIKEMKAQAVF